MFPQGIVKNILISVDFRSNLHDDCLHYQKGYLNQYLNDQCRFRLDNFLSLRFGYIINGQVLQ